MMRATGSTIIVAVIAALTTSFLNGFGGRAGEDAWNALKIAGATSPPSYVASIDYFRGDYVSAPELRYKKPKIK